jgi:hypothetical protein
VAESLRIAMEMERQAFGMNDKDAGIHLADMPIGPCQDRHVAEGHAMGKQR